MTAALTPQNCLLCGGAESRTIFSYPVPDAYERAVGVTDRDYDRRWVACRGCGFHYARYARDPDILDTLYDRAYRDPAAAWRGDPAETVFRRVIALPPDQSETVARCSMIKSALDRFAEDGIHVSTADRPRRLLDVGGATGVFAYHFRDADWSAEIVDPGIDGQFLEQHGIACHRRRFDDAFAGTGYGLVAMNYLLEHVADPRAVLGKARRVVADDGLLYVEVPDEIAFEKKPAEDDIFNSCHLWMFGPASLTRLLTSCGFDPLEMRRIRTLRGHFALTALARPR